MSTGVCSPKEDEYPNKNLEQIDGRVASGDNSGDLTVPYVRINGGTMKEGVGQAQNTQGTLSISQPNSGNINTNNPASSTNRNSDVHSERHGNTGEGSSCDRGEERHSPAMVPHEMDDKQTAKDNNNRQKETVKEQQGNNKMTMDTQPAVSAAGTSNFSFAMTNTLTHLTPHLNAGNSIGEHNLQEKGERKEGAQEHMHDQTKEKHKETHNQHQQIDKERRSLEGINVEQKQGNA